MIRRILPTALVVTGSILALVAVLAVWISRQVLETDQWTQTSSEVLEQPAVQAAVSGFLVEQLYTHVDVAGELRAALPDQADALAGPAAGALRSAIGDVALRAMETPQLQSAWQDANRGAHRLLLRVIEGGGEAVSTEGGVVTLDLRLMLEELQRRTGVGGRLAGLLPDGAASIRILRSDQLSTAQNIANALKPIALLLVLLMVACYAAAIWLAAGRRRQMLRAAGIGMIFAGVGALVARRFLGESVVDSLATSAAARPAVEATWEVGTSLLVGVAGATILYGAVAVLGTWFAGRSRWAVRLRQHTSPYLADARIAYGGLTALILLLVLWGPTEGTRRILPALLLTALLAAGVEALRRQAKRELAEGGPEDSKTAVQLGWLEELHRSGGLDDASFTAAKQRVLTHT